MKLAMIVNKAHGGGQLRWLMSLPAQSLIDLQSCTAEWLEENLPEDRE